MLHAHPHQDGIHHVRQRAHEWTSGINGDVGGNARREEMVGDPALYMVLAVLEARQVRWWLAASRRLKPPLLLSGGNKVEAVIPWMDGTRVPRRVSARSNLAVIAAGVRAPERSPLCALHLPFFLFCMRQERVR